MQDWKLPYHEDVEEEINQYADRLGLSTGELLALAREVTGCARLRTIDRLTMDQRIVLIQLLASLPCEMAA